MGEFSAGIGLLILIGSLLIVLFFSRKEPINCRLIYLLLGTGIFLYSGIGIAYKSVDNRYLIPYFEFLFSILCTIRIVLHLTRNGKFPTIYRTSLVETFDQEIDVASDSKVVKGLAFLFLMTSVVYLFVPTFRLQDFFMPKLANIVTSNVYATNAAYNSNTILKIASTINILCMPFFLLNLQELLGKGKKGKAIALTILWMYLEFLEKNYLGRYKLVIYFIFIFSIAFFVRKDGVKLDIKKLAIMGGIMALSVPLLYALIDIRTGGSFQRLSFSNALNMLLESEIYYPTHYQQCSSIFESNGSLGLKFLLYLICLPIPSIIFPGKPTVNASFYLTYAVSGKWFGAANYTSSLPSVVGEGIIIWGESFVWLHGIVLGIFIGLVFKYLMRYKSLTIIYLYYLVNLLIVGRGGAESYMSGLINGTFYLILWAVILKRYKHRNTVADLSHTYNT